LPRGGTGPARPQQQGRRSRHRRGGDCIDVGLAHRTGIDVTDRRCPGTLRDNRRDSRKRRLLLPTRPPFEASRGTGHLPREHRPDAIPQASRVGPTVVRGIDDREQQAFVCCSSLVRKAETPTSTYESELSGGTHIADLRVNGYIRAPEVRVVAPDGEQIGVRKLAEALWLAEQLGLDLVEVAPNANPPVCRLMDYGKYKYEQSVRDREARKKQSRTQVKELRMKVRIGQHDFDINRRRAEEFLGDGDKVKVTIRF